MSDIGSSNISFSSIKSKYVASSITSASNNSFLRDGKTNSDIKMSYFRGATLSDGTVIPSTNDISINSNFRNKTFGTSVNKHETGDFYAHSNWSGHSTSLQGSSGSSIYTGSTTTNKRVELFNKGQSSSYPYPILLLSPNSSSSSTPGIIVDRTDNNVVDEATVWFRVVSHYNYSQVQMGILAKDMTLDNWTQQKSYIHNKHAIYCDRLCFHGGGYHNYAGSHDDITDSSTIVSPQYKSGTYGSDLTTNFHTRTGTTAGTQPSSNAASSPSSGNSVFFFQSNLSNYSTYRSNGLYPNHGLKIKWYETTLTVKLVKDSNIIEPVSSSWSNTDLADVFAGMYISGTGINTNDGAFIGDIHTNYMRMYKSKGISSTSLQSSIATSDESNVTLTINGYLYWTLVTSPDYSNSNTNYVDAKILGPPHQVLPKYQASSSSSAPSTEITEWAFFIGDTTSGTTNTLQYDIRNEEPGGTAFSYSVSYSSGTVPSSSLVTNHIQMKYHRYGSTFNDSWTPYGSLTIEDGTFVLYFWNTSDNSLTKLGTRLSNQTHTSSFSSYSTITYDITQPEGTTGYLLFIIYGWNMYRADMGIGYVAHQYDDNTTKQILYSPSSNSTTARNSQTWMKTQRQDVLKTSYSSTTVSNLEDEIATKSRSLSSSSWSNLGTGTSFTGGWQQDSQGTVSSSTGPNRGSDGSSNSYYIYCETSGISGTSILAYAALRVPITIESNDV